MLRCFLSPGGWQVWQVAVAGSLVTGSPALRLVCPAAKPCVGEIGKQISFHYLHIFKFQFHTRCLLIRKIGSEAVTTRWPSTQVAASWSGGRWRADSFLHQGTDYELPRSTVSSTSPVVLMMTTSSPRSSPGTQSPSRGNKLETSLWRETTMQPSPFQLHLLNVNWKKIKTLNTIGNCETVWFLQFLKIFQL